MLLSIGKRGVHSNGQKGGVQLVSTLAFYPKKATIKVPAAP
jgi:hypothetical protein